MPDGSNSGSDWAKTSVSLQNKQKRTAKTKENEKKTKNEKAEGKTQGTERKKGKGKKKGRTIGCNGHGINQYHSAASE